MAKTYRTSRGEVVDIDMLRLANESTIAVGNMRTNARGDQLGAGGKVVKTRAQVMQEYHKLNTPMADDLPVMSSRAHAAIEDPTTSIDKKLATPTAIDTPVLASAAEYVKPRGSFADAVAKETEVTQELLEPTTRTSSTGVTRI
jgi:hypothetical protein